MKRTRMLSILLAVLLVFSCSAAVLAAEPMTVTVETKADAVSVGEEVSLTVSIAGNPGFTNYEWAVEYDAASLELKKVENKLSAYLATREEEGRVNLALMSAEPISENGTAFVVTFLVKEKAAAGLSEVKLSSKKLANLSQTLQAQYIAGGVTIASTTGGSTTGGSTTGGSTTGGSTTGGSTTGGSTTGGSTTGGSTTGGSTTGGSTTGGSTTGGSTTGGSTTGSDCTVELVGKSNNATHTVTGNTLNVQNDVACVVLWTDDGGKTYTKLAATANEAGGYDFDLTNVPANAVIKIAIKGDMNGDGVLGFADATMVMNAYGNDAPLSKLAELVADVDGISGIQFADATRIMNAWGNDQYLDW